jgi:hypothetical protein
MRKSCSVVAVLVLCLASWAARAEEIRDGVVADPEAHQVVLENEYVRVFEAMAAPGHKSPMHSHPPILLVSLDDARVKMTLPDGKTQIFDLKPGAVHWFGGGAQHSWELLSGNLHVFGIEIKGAKPTPPPAK